MTISEKLQKVGYKVKLASRGDTLQSLCFQIYGEHSQMGILVLSYLNNRLDWSDLEVGAEIRYIEKEFIKDIEEIW